MEEASELDRLGVIDWTKSWFGRRVLKNLYTRSKAPLHTSANS